MFAWCNSSRRESASTTRTFGAPTCVIPPQMGKRKFARSVQFFQAGNRKFLCLVQRLRGVGQALSRTEELIDRIPVWGSYFFARFEGQKPWQHLRDMHDFGSLDAKRGPSWQDLYAMYPKPPDCTWKWTHRARILPFRSRKAYISGKYCQEEGLLHAFVEKRMHTARFLPGAAVKQSQHEGWMRALRGGAAAARGAGGEHSPPWFIGDSSLAQIRWSLRGGRLQ